MTVYAMLTAEWDAWESCERRVSKSQEIVPFENEAAALQEARKKNLSYVCIHEKDKAGRYFILRSILDVFPDHVTLVLVMDGKKHQLEFKYTAALNLFFRKNKKRIYGILACGSSNPTKLRELIKMHGIKYV